MAPIKPVTIPRMELTAAVVAVRLARYIRKELEFKLDKVTYWCDSTAVLHYIANTTTRYQTFVANRLKVIHDLSTVDEWRYVSTHSNPADLASRGAYPNKYKDYESWFHGPPFLRSTEACWPVSPLIPSLSDDTAEVKGGVNILQVYNTAVEPVEQTCLNDLWLRYSDWFRLQKAVAWLLRFKDLCKTRFLLKRSYEGSPILQQSEIDAATEAIIRCVQQEKFGVQIKQLSQTSPGSRIVPALPKRHLRKANEWKSLQRLSPFLEDGILRVGGRIQRSALPFHVKHPVILPPHHHVTRLLVEHFHKQEGHCGTNHVLAAIREFYWIIRGQSTVRSIIRQCQIYRLRFAAPGQQRMAPLPSCRLTFGHPPFYFTGVDYMGPVLVKSGRSTPKRYICVFTCMATRAVHLEVLHSLDTSSFLQALSRFISRRTKPSEIWSDNGSNFVGAERELRTAVRQFDTSDMHNAMLKHNINWHFNPPASSHQGGVWERVIHSVRRVLYSIIADRVLNAESLHTFIVEVEQILNNRPITSLSDDPRGQFPSDTQNDFKWCL